MLNEFLYDYDDDQMEPSMEALYTFFGIDDFTPATEAFANIKEKFKKMAEKIRNFVRKCIEWIKTKFYALLKIDTIKIDKTRWKNCIALLKELDGVKIPPLKQIGSYITIGRVAGAVASDNLAIIKEKDDKRLTAMVDELRTKLDAVKKGPIYAKVLGWVGTDSPENLITVRVAPLASEKAKLAKLLKSLEDSAAVLSNLQIDDNTSVSAKAVAKFNEATAIAIEKVNLQIRVINKVIYKWRVPCSRQNAKDKNTKRLYY